MNGACLDRFSNQEGKMNLFTKLWRVRVTVLRLNESSQRMPPSPRHGMEGPGQGSVPGQVPSIPEAVVSITGFSKPAQRPCKYLGKAIQSG
jgi:hypothetical protein